MNRREARHIALISAAGLIEGQLGVGWEMFDHFDEEDACKIDDELCRIRDRLYEMAGAAGDESFRRLVIESPLRCFPP